MYFCHLNFCGLSIHWIALWNHRVPSNNANSWRRLFFHPSKNHWVCSLRRRCQFWLSRFGFGFRRCRVRIFHLFFFFFFLVSMKQWWVQFNIIEEDDYVSIPCIGVSGNGAASSCCCSLGAPEEKLTDFLDVWEGGVCKGVRTEMETIRQIIECGQLTDWFGWNGFFHFHWSWNIIVVRIFKHLRLWSKFTEENKRVTKL